MAALLGGPGGSVVRIAAFFYGIVLLFAIGYAVFSGKAGTFLGERMPTGNGMLLGLVVGLAIAGACQLLARNLPVVSAAADELQKILGPMSWGAIAALALASGIAEELLFRGALWPHLGLVGSTLLFALVHFVPKRSLVFYPVFALGAGFVIGLLRNGTENVLPCVIAHVAVNAVNLAWLESRRRRTAALAAPAVAAAPPAA
jgi:membrane protease YdiL (CAAX protease family)